MAPTGETDAHWTEAPLPAEPRDPVLEVLALKLKTHSQIAENALPGIKGRSKTWVEAHELSASWRWEWTTGQRRRHGGGHSSLEELSLSESRWIALDCLPSPTRV